jgi:crotonobetainyl-CoA:carnitine CoA-transferase CaiB-like acyl-CoA transferase
MEVIKIEPCHHPDPDRIAPASLSYLNNNPGNDPWNRAMLYLRRTRHKLSATLNLAVPEGRDIFLKLVEISDVVVENFRIGVLERLKLGYSELRKTNPRIILMTLSSQGNKGPEREYGTNGEIISFLSGLRSITDYPDEIGLFAQGLMADPLSGTVAAGFVMAALRYRRHTGKGTHLVISQRMLATSVIGEAVMDYFMNKRLTQPRGNSHSFLAPYGCYPCKGRNRWITLAIRDDQEWQKLCRLMQKPELATHPDFDSGLNRWHHRHEVDRLVGQWTIQYRAKEVMNLLQREKISAGAVYSPKDLIEDEHLRGRFWETVNDPRPEYGDYTMPGRGFYLSRTKIGAHFRAPGMGEHNCYVYGELLGISPKKIEALEKKGIIGNSPTPEIQARIPAFQAKEKSNEG